MKCPRCKNEAAPGIQLCERCRQSQRVRGKRWFQRHADELRLKARQRRIDSRTEVMARLGGRCVCCGETEDAFLTVDHPNGDGATHRRKNNQGGMFLWTRMLADWGTFELRILCWNCHRAVSMKGACPHQRSHAA